MYQFNEQFTKAYGQFADVAANANRLALENAEKAFGLHFAAIEENANATFAYVGELIEVRDAEDLKAVWPKGLQVARANAERALGATQEAFASTLKTNEAIGSLAKGQFEKATAQAKAEVEKVTKAASKAAK
ncbi:phasin family protein [Thermomonas brevis]